MLIALLCAVLHQEQTAVLQTPLNLIVCQSSVTHDYKFLLNVRETLHTISAHVMLLTHDTAVQSLA